MVILQATATALYKQLRYDFDLVWMRIRGTRRNLQGQPISSPEAMKQLAEEQIKKAKPSHWYPLLRVRFEQLRETAIAEWHAFRADMEKLRERVKRFRNPTNEQKSVGDLSPFYSEKRLLSPPVL